VTILTAAGTPAQTSQAPAPWVNDVRRLLDTDPCPCGTTKSFETCCRAPLKEGLTPENTLHLLFTAVLLPADGCDGCGSPTTRLLTTAQPHDQPTPCRICGRCRCEACLPLPKKWAVQTAKMTGEVPAEEVVQNIRGRLAVPAVQRTVVKLGFKDLPKDVTVIPVPAGTTIVS
jgi:hypothetical protein